MPGVAEQICAPLILVLELRLTRQLANRPCLPLAPQLLLLLSLPGVRKEKAEKAPNPSAPAHGQCHCHQGPHHVLPLLLPLPLRQEADVHFDGWFRCCWQDDHPI